MRTINSICLCMFITSVAFANEKELVKDAGLPDDQNSDASPAETRQEEPDPNDLLRDLIAQGNHVDVRSKYNSACNIDFKTPHNDTGMGTLVFRQLGKDDLPVKNASMVGYVRYHDDSFLLKIEPSQITVIRKDDMGRETGRFQEKGQTLHATINVPTVGSVKLSLECSH